MSRINRRRFLEHSLLATTATLVLPGMTPQVIARPTRRKVGANDVIRVGVVGVRGRGRAHIGAFKKSPDSEVVAICDADSGVIGPAQESVPNATYYQDMREMLADPTIDAVSIAMPNHWHSLATIWAIDAGKHVYVEKPISHTVWEGRAVVNAARRSGLIVQHGTQGRSHTAIQEALAWLRAGGLGRVTLAHGLCYKRRQSIGKTTATPALPETLDIDLWTGPAAMEPINRGSVHYDWHWVFNTGNGDIGNQGVHQMDIARWGLGLDDFPASVTSVGGRVGYDDDGETPNSHLTLFDYGEKQIVFEVRGLVTDPYKSAHIGVVFHGEGGYLVSTANYGLLTAYDNDGQVIRTFEGAGNHFQNFLDAVRSGNTSDLNAPAIEGHRSAALCHLGNISYMLGAPQSLSSSEPPFGDHEHSNEAFRSLRLHLQDNGVSAETDVHMGPTLTFDDAPQRFHGDHADAANPMLKRHYRPGYEIPEDLGAV